MQKGTIGVTTENIFPIIKKFLYSDHEIFLRELVSNGVDAVQKLNALIRSGELKGEAGELKVTVTADPKKGTLTISDTGIGMTAEEVDKYINQIAFSSAGEFLDKYKNQIDSIIGHFGLGFYSAFMVAKKVEIDTLSWREGAEPVKWSCKGDPNYEIGKGKRKERGTDITLYLDDESKEYAEEGTVRSLLTKYCSFLPVEVFFGEELINDTKPIWTKRPTEIEDEEYMEFYRKLYPMQEDPLFHIHLNVDFPFTLTGVLYFPKIKDGMEISRNKIQLYSNQVFVTDSVENIVPDFLTLLHGVIDSPDIPLNVSRSYLQSDPNVKKISGHITKKVADRLEELFKNEREKLEERWDNLKLFIEYGMLSEERFYERAEKFALLKSSNDKYFSFEEYRELIKGNQTDKHGKLIYLYSTDLEEQFSFVESAKNRGYDVLVMDSHLDSHFVNLLESKFEESQFVRVDADHIDKLIDKKEIEASKLTEAESDEISVAFKAVMPSDANYSFTVENLGEEESALLITQSEFMRRYREMAALGGGLNFYGSLPDSYSVIINESHPAVVKVLSQKEEQLDKELQSFREELTEKESELKSIEATEEPKEEAKKEERFEKIKVANDALDEVRGRRDELLTNFANENDLIKQLRDLALLANGLLKGEELDRFIKRSLTMID